MTAARCMLVYEEGNVALVIPGTVHSIELVIADARERGEDVFKLYHANQWVHYRTDIPWRVEEMPT